MCRVNRARIVKITRPSEEHIDYKTHMDKDYDWVLTYDTPALSLTTPVESGTKDDRGQQIFFVGTAHIMIAECTDIYNKSEYRYYIKHIEPSWLKVQRDYQEMCIRSGYVPPTKEEIERRETETKAKYPLTAEDVWYMAIMNREGYTYESHNMSGTFYECSGTLNFSCGDINCCFDSWDKKEDFMRAHGDDFFREIQ